MMNSVKFVDSVANKSMNLGDVRHIPADNEQYDCVTAFSLLHHLARKNKTESGEQVASAYKEIFRVLKLGGVLVVAENCPGPLEWPYHLCFSAFYPLALKLFDTELPYFWPAKQHQRFANDAGFDNSQGYVHVPIVESVFQPVIGMSTPPLLNGDLV